MGLIDDGSAAPAPATDGGDVIAKTRAAFEQKVPADQQASLQRIILAGQKILYDKTTNSAVEKRLQSSDNPAAAAGAGAAELLSVLMRESRGTLPKALIGPATGVLLTEILDYMKQTGRIEGTAADLETATRAMSETVMKGSGGNFDQILSKTSEAMKDPAIAAKMQQHMQGA